MSFGEWRAYLEPMSDFGRHHRLNIGREIAPGEVEVVTALGSDGVTIERVKHEEGATSGTGVQVPVFLGEVLYKALHRVYGQEHQDGKVEALEDSLKKERERVDFVLNRALATQALQPAHRFVGGES